MNEQERAEFRDAIAGPCAEIGAILTESMNRQRQENRDHLLGLFRTARNRVGGEFAEALIQVMLVVNRWEEQAMTPDDAGMPQTTIELTDAAADILAAIETGLGANA